MIVNLRDQEALAERLPDERRPARAHERRRRLGELTLEGVEAPEVAPERLGERAARPPARLGREVRPEERVQHVARQVEGQRALERGQRRELALGASLLEALE